MLTHEEMIGLQAERHELIGVRKFKSREQYVLHLIHSFAYAQAKMFVEDKKVLDLGCNTGYGTELLSQAAKRVVGVDVSRKAISIAKEKYNSSNIDFHLVDGKELPFGDGEFDFIISCQVIEHIVDYNVFLDELKRVLSPTGVAVFTTPNAQLRLDPGMKPWNKFHVREFDDSELQELMEIHFSSVKIMGLFAEESTYLVEKKRLTRARNSARRRQQRGFDFLFRSAVKNVLPRGVVGKLRKLLAGTSPSYSEIDKTIVDEHGLRDFFYRSDEMADALDLLAFCTNDAVALEEIERKLQMD